MKIKKNKPVIIIGSGGHSKVLIDILKETKRNILGVTDPYKKKGDKHFGFNIIGTDAEIFKFSNKEIELVNGIGLNSKKKSNLNLTKKFMKCGYIFTKVIHPSSYISKSVLLGDSVQIMPGVIINANVRIDHSVLINTKSSIDHDCHIQHGCHIAPGAILCGNVNVGKYTHIGAGTVIIENIKIGDNCLIAAGTVVYKNIQSGLKYVQVKKDIFTKN